MSVEKAGLQPVRDKPVLNAVSTAEVEPAFEATLAAARPVFAFHLITERGRPRAPQDDRLRQNGDEALIADKTVFIVKRT